MNFNNRQPVYQEKEYVSRTVFHREIKDGISVFVKGAKPNLYKDVKCDSLKLKSRIDSGVFEDHEGSPYKVEKASGSDIMTAQIEKEQNKIERLKEVNVQRKHAKEIYDKVFSKDEKNVDNKVEKDN